MKTRSSKAVDDFFSTLLDEPSSVSQIVADTVQLKPLAQLLARVSDATPKVDICNEIPPPLPIEAVPVLVSSPAIATDIDDKEINEVSVCAGNAVTISPLTQNTLKQQMASEFPVLYFKVAGVTMAVPLVKLRAIYPLASITKIIAQPSWYCGIQVERGQNINVIDTAKYLMEEKYNSQLEQSLNYKYIVVLGDSNWGLLCDELTDSSALSHDDVKWRSAVTKSPWLAGIVKHRMCGLLAVDALTQLLDGGSE